MKNKKLHLVIEISQLLKQYQCTYSEVKEILSILTDEFNQQQEDLEYDTLDDYFSGCKNRNMENEIIQPLNHVDGYF